MEGAEGTAVSAVDIAVPSRVLANSCCRFLRRSLNSVTALDSCIEKIGRAREGREGNKDADEDDDAAEEDDDSDGKWLSGNDDGGSGGNDPVAANGETLLRSSPLALGHEMKMVSRR